MALFDKLSQYWNRIQGCLFPKLEEELGELTQNHLKLISILELIRIEEFISISDEGRGRKRKQRTCISRAFVAKAVYNMSTTRDLMDRILCDSQFRRICGWESKADVPSESTFSRAFEEFSNTHLPEKVHEALIKNCFSDEIIGHISTDSTEINGREKPIKKEAVKVDEEKPKSKAGRPKKGEEVQKEPTRLEKQCTMNLAEMLEELPTGCDTGTKKNSKGFKESWVGYKFHISAGDGQFPISCILTSASLHDSQAAIPLLEMNKKRVVNLYDLMDAAYDSPIIRRQSELLGHVPIIDVNPRRNKSLKEELLEEERRRNILNFKYPQEIRYNERTTVERVNARLKEEFGGRMVRVRGHLKVMAHLMFGILALTADQLFKLVT